MKLALLIALGLVVAGSGQEFNQREVLSRLKAVETELAKRPVPVRWAYADRNRIRTAIHLRSIEKLAELKKADALSPEVEAKVAHYEALRMELIRLPVPPPRPARPPSPPPPPKSIGADLLSFLPLPQPKPAAPASPAQPPLPKPAELEKENAYAELARRVAEAKAPVDVIVDRRAGLVAKYQHPQFIEQLIADYVKLREHYDLVVDSSQGRMSFFGPVLYHTAGEVPDITEGVIQFFRDREKR
ncbi:MAG: hypothetical protein RL514_2120 [Verrucomicrobiota bacterium]|jgi:hypothetical protein